VTDYVELQTSVFGFPNVEPAMAMETMDVEKVLAANENPKSKTTPDQNGEKSAVNRAPCQ
jgi:hypothetical protein